MTVGDKVRIQSITTRLPGCLTRTWESLRPEFYAATVGRVKAIERGVVRDYAIVDFGHEYSLSVPIECLSSTRLDR